MQSTRLGNMYTKIQIEMKKAMLERELNQLPVVKCGTCEHWKDSCGKFGEAPPVEVQAVGCDAWEWDGVPF